jgi:hypothetical protein
VEKVLHLCVTSKKKTPVSSEQESTGASERESGGATEIFSVTTPRTLPRHLYFCAHALCLPRGLFLHMSVHFCDISDMENIL